MAPARQGHPSYGTGAQAAPSNQTLASHRKVVALGIFACAAALVASIVVNAPAKRIEMLSEWDIDSDLTPAAIAERRHPFTAVKHKVPIMMPSAMKALSPEAKKQMLMYGHVDLPQENFAFKKESGAPQCEDGCAFQDKVFTVEGFDQLCLTHCGEIDAILKDASKGQRKSIELAQNVVHQQLAAMKVPKGQKLETKGSDKSWTKSPNFSAKGYWPVVGDDTGRKLTKLLVNKEQEEWKKNNNFNKHGYWPLNGNEKKLKTLGLNVDALPVGKEHEMPEQYSTETVADKGFYQHFFDTGKKLKHAGVSVRKSGEHLTGESGYKSKVVQLDQNFKTSGYWPLTGEPNKLEKQGVRLDEWPQGREKPMPEQYSDEDPTQLNFYKHFFDTGSRLESAGVNLKKSPLGEEKVKGDDKPFKKAKINMYQWPWDA